MNIVDFMNLPQLTDYCAYHPEKLCTELYSYTNWLKGKNFRDFPVTAMYSDFKEKGFCRYYFKFYMHKCYGCNECMPIRLRPAEFKASKSQLKTWKKNQDLEVTLVVEPENFVTEEKTFLFREYNFYHNKENGRYSMEDTKLILTQMNSGYDGIWNMEYRLNGKLIGVAVLDYTTTLNGKINSLCSNYFYYDTTSETLKRSIGVFSVLKEIELCNKMEIPYYYLGLYLQHCHKMNYKTNYRPYELYINNKWVKEENLPEALRGQREEETAPLERVAEDSLLAEDRERLLPKKIMTLPPAGSFSDEYPDFCFITEFIDTAILYSAYNQGIFPWYNEDEGEPVIWQSPDPRFVIFPENFHVSKSIDKFLKHTPYTYTKDKAFEQVMQNCGAQFRPGQNGSWIGPQMLEAYKKFHEEGYAHSYEVWLGEKLVGGFYGIDLGTVFCGESMFTIEPNSSKSAFVLFARDFFARGGKMIDCQSETENMKRYGGVNISREEYLRKLQECMENHKSV